MAILFSSVALGSAVCSLFGTSFILVSYLRFSSPSGSWTQFFHTNPDDGITALIAFLAFCHYSICLHTITGFAPTLYWLIEGIPLPQLNSYCNFRSGWFQISTGASVLWTACISVYLYLVIFHRTRVLLNTAKIWIVLNFICWGLPILLFLISYSLKGIKQTPLGICTPQEPYLLALWFAPNCTLFILTLLIYIFIHIRLSGNAPNDIQANPREIPFKFRITLFFIVYLVCWVVDISTYIYSHWYHCVPFGMITISVFLFLMRGFMDAAVYTLTTSKLRSHYKGISFYKLVIWVLLAPFIVIPNIVYFLYRKFKQIQCFDERGSGESSDEDSDSSNSYGSIHGSSLLYNPRS